MKKSTQLNINVKHLAALSNLVLSPEELIEIKPQFVETLGVVDQLNEINTNETIATPQVTGLINVFRQDKIDKNRILSQSDALANANKTHQGYFVVPQLIDHEA